MSQGDRGKVRIGVIGTGAICQLMHLPILSERRDVEVAAVADLDDLKAQSVARRFGVGRVLDDDALVSDEGIEGVVICAPSFVHESLAGACLEAGKHVLVERPLALSAGGVRWIMKAAREAGRGVILGWRTGISRTCVRSARRSPTAYWGSSARFRSPGSTGPCAVPAEDGAGARWNRGAER